MFDVVVVGGNLAGAFAAINAAEKGVSVALVERRKEPFFPAHCAEAIPDVTYDMFNLDKLGCPKNQINKIIINISSKEYVFNLSRNKVYVINRSFLENELQKKAEKTGVKMFLGRRMTRYNPSNELLLDNGKKITGKVIIDASGIVCTLGKQIKIDTTLKPADIGVCIQSRARGHFNADTIYMRFHEPYAPFGYAWFFPISNEEVNIGLGISGGQNIDLKKLLEDYIDLMIKGKYKIIHTFRACEPLASPLTNLVKNNVMFVGDAGRLVEPASGAGIHNAFFSGSLAGLIAAKYILGEVSSLEIYQDAMKNKIKRIRKTYYKKSKLKTSSKFQKGFNRAFLMLYFANKIFSNFYQGRVAKILKKDGKILNSFSD